MGNCLASALHPLGRRRSPPAPAPPQQRHQKDSVVYDFGQYTPPPPTTSDDSPLLSPLVARTRSEAPPPPAWSDILLELAGLVIRLLPAHVDRVRFAAVCTQWHAAARLAPLPLPLPLPLLLLSDGTTFSLPHHERLRFSGRTGCAGACGDWLVSYREEGPCLVDPLSSATVTLPAVSRIRILQHVVNDGDEIGLAWTQSEGAEKMTVFKLIFVSSHLIAAFVRFRASSRIAVCQRGAASWWSVHMDNWFPSFVDTTFYQGKLYAIDLHEFSLFAIDVSVDCATGDPWVSQLRRVINSVPSYPHAFMANNVCMDMLNLVESCGALLMVRRWKTVPIEVGGGSGVVAADGHGEFEVFEADFERSQWTKVTTIGDDRVLFLSRRCSRSVCVSPYETPGDCIVFLENDGEDRLLYSEESSSSCCVYNMRDGNVLALFSWKRDAVPVAWLFPTD